MNNVYMLFDNTTNSPLYVGVTKNTVNRLSGHKCTTIKNYPNKEYVSLEILEIVNDSDAPSTEQFWYWQIKSWGFNLLQKDCRLHPAPQESKLSLYQVALLATAFGKSTQTINRWIKSNDDRLTSEKAKVALLKTKK